MLCRISAHTEMLVIDFWQKNTMLVDDECSKGPFLCVRCQSPSARGGLEALFYDPCVQARSVRVNGQHRCTLAHSYTDPPSCPVCIVFSLLSSVFCRGDSLCFLLSQRPLRFYPQPTCPGPCCERAYSPQLTWVKRG